MKRLLLIVFLVTIFFMLALPVFVYGLYQREMAKAEEFIAVFDFEGSTGVYNGIEKRFDSAKGLSWIFDSWRKDIENHKAANHYWQKKYFEVVNEVLANESASKDKNSDMEFIRANSLFRVIQKEENKTKVLEFLDQAINAYRTTTTNDPVNFNAAFNYEYLLLVRNEISSGKRPLPLTQSEQKGKPNVDKSQSKDGNQSGQTREGIHGREGANPQDSQRDKIKIHVPLGPDNPKEKGGEEAGKGEVKRKKG